MRLFRFAIINIHGKADAWRDLTVTRAGVRVRVMETLDRGVGLALAVCADVSLSDPPRSDDNGVVAVPDEPRRLTEKAIDAAANLVSVATGNARSITSRNLPVAFYIESDNDRAFISSQTNIERIDQGVAFGRMSVHVTPDDLKALRDREDGVALLAEALSQDHMSGRYRELLRVFELAFAESEGKLILVLSEFLAKRPRLGYTKTEVKQWVKRLRGRAIHADRSAPLIGSDLADVVDRMLLATYEVLFNKEKWHSYDSARRDVWTPRIGPLDAVGSWFVVQHQTEAPMNAQLYDPYGVYPLDLRAPGLRLGDSNFWPTDGPAQTTAGGHPMTIMPVSELAAM